MQKSEIASLIYHDLFDYPLTDQELLRWRVNPQKIKNLPKSFKPKSFRLRALNAKYSQKKLKIARAAAKVLIKIPSIQLVGVTGSLAMLNAKPNADIDLLIITSKQTLWVSRLVCYLLLRLSGFSIRKPGGKERDKLCLNMWMDERDLKFPQQNIYTAHEIAQVIPLVNKNQTYERFIYQNKWLFDYWPNAVEKLNVSKRLKSNRFLYVFNRLAFALQYFYMKNRITREQINETRAFFHPFDWGEKVIEELKKRGLEFKHPS